MPDPELTPDQEIQAALAAADDEVQSALAAPGPDSAPGPEAGSGPVDGPPVEPPPEPTRPIMTSGTRGLEPPTAPEEKPWYSRLVDSGKQAADGVGNFYKAQMYGAGDVTGVQDEASAALTGALPDPKDPEGYTREYAAGNRGADVKNWVQGEQKQARKESPAGYYSGMGLGIGGIAAATAPAAAAMPIATGAAVGGATSVANREGPLEQRVLDEMDNPGGTILGGALPAIGQEVAPVAAKVGQRLGDAASRMRTHIFMTPGQRAAYAAAKGPGSLEELSKDAADAGLYKAPWWRTLTANKVADNAAKVQSKTGAGIGEFEKGLADSELPVDVKPIAQDLTTRGEAVRKLVDGGAGADARAFSGLARRITTDPERASAAAEAAGASRGAAKSAREAKALASEAKAVARLGGNPPEMKAAAQQAEITALQRGQAARAAQQANEAAHQEVRANPREFMPIKEAIANKRDLGDRVKWMANPNAPTTTMGADRARRVAWRGFKDGILDTLKKDAGNDIAKTGKLGQYIKDNKDFSTAATVFDPAMRMAERNAQGASARDIALATALADQGGLAVLAGKRASGALPAVTARTMDTAGAAVKAAGVPFDAARNQPAAAAAAVSRARRDENEQLKKQLLRRPSSTQTPPDPNAPQGSF